MSTLEELLTNSASDKLSSIPPPAMEGTASQQVDRMLGGVDLQQMFATMSTPPTEPKAADMGWLYEDSDISNTLATTTNSRYEGSNDMSDGPQRRVREDGSSYPDPDLPDAMKDFTGMKTWGDFLGAGFRTAITGIATLGGGPVVGSAVAGVLDAAEDPTERTAISGMEDVVLSSVDKFGVSKLAQTAHIYNKQDGIINSIMDAGRSLMDDRHAPTTVAGWNAAGGLEGQIERNRADVAAANKKPTDKAPTTSTHESHHGGDGPTRPDHTSSYGGPDGRGESAGAVSGGR